jgi:hypothetical protein
LFDPPENGDPDFFGSEECRFDPALVKEAGDQVPDPIRQTCSLQSDVNEVMVYGVKSFFSVHEKSVKVSAAGVLDGFIKSFVQISYVIFKDSTFYKTFLGTVEGGYEGRSDGSNDSLRYNTVIGVSD